MEKMYTATATVVGGRNGHIKSADGILDLDVRVPKEMGGEPDVRATNPEELFAAGYSSCFNQAVMAVGRHMRLDLDKAEVTVSVSIGKDTDGRTFKLSAEITGKFFGITKEQADKVMHDAHMMCPYSKATRGNIDVTLHSQLG